jgi:septum formation protein
VIVLASASATRARMLKEAGIAFEVAAPGLDEAAAKARLNSGGASPRQVAEHLAEAKALAVAAAPAALVIGADQTLDLDGALLDKAVDVNAARARLERLRGRAHQLHTAAAIARDGEVIWRRTSSPILTMRPFSDGFLDHYLASCVGAAVHSLGCYHLEGMGAQLFDRVEGDYFAVLGLPLIELLAALHDLGAIAA